MGSLTRPHWKEIVDQKRRVQEEAIQKHIKLHGAHVDPSSITSVVRVEELIQSISSGAITAKQICLSSINKTIAAHKHTNCLTEVLFEDAVRRAEELDRYFQEHGKVIGPLHGVPMSLKDQFDVEGYDTTLGYVGRALKPAKEDAVLVAILKRLGAVIIAKTNLPQSIMWCETENPLWGLTVNPRRPDFTPGGSTGGEACVLSMEGSMVGWGTDIGGSVRIPSHMLGLYGLKPSSTRLPYQGVPVSTEGQEHVPSVVGPLTRSLEALKEVTKSVIEAEPWHQDPRCCPLPWRNGQYLEVQSRPLVVGLMLDDGVVKVHPPIARILQDLATKLQEAGHEVISWNPEDLHQQCIDIMDSFYTADGGEDIRREVEAGGEPFIPHVEALVNRGKAISVYEYWQLNKRKHAAQKRFLDKWNSTASPIGRKLDVLLTPVMPHPAVPHRKCRWVGYTKVFNFVDYSSVVIPAGTVSRELDPTSEAREPYQPRNPLDQWNWDLYDLESMDGMPINVQIVGGRLEEEKVLGVAEVFEALLRN